MDVTKQLLEKYNTKGRKTTNSKYRRKYCPSSIKDTSVQIVIWV